MKQAGILSTKTAVEKNTESTPDEAKRIEVEIAAANAIANANVNAANQTNGNE